VSDTLTSLDVRSLIIRNLQRCNHYLNTDNLQRLEKEAQIKKIDTPKTDKTLSVSDRTLLALSYADTVIISGHTARPDGYMLHGQVNTKSKTYLIIEMIPHLVFYSYERKYHKLASMFVPGYRCSNVYINVEKGALINKDIQ
jgi:hypothetical protein